MSTSPSPYVFRKAGALAYELRDRASGELIGTMRRGRAQDEWRIRPVDGRLDVSYTSRDTAAGVLVQMRRAIVAGLDQDSIFGAVER